MPRSSQRRTMRSSTSSGAVENVITTCWILKRPIASSRSQLAPATGTPSSPKCRRAAPCRGTRRDGSRAPGLSRRRLATSAPTRPAPTISVGLTLSPAARARCVRPVPRDAGPAATYASANAQSRTVSRAEVGGRAEQDTCRQDDHRRERRRDEDRPKVVERVEPEPELIQPARPVEREAEDDEGAVAVARRRGDAGRVTSERRRRRPPGQHCHVDSQAAASAHAVAGRSRDAAARSRRGRGVRPGCYRARYPPCLSSAAGRERLRPLPGDAPQRTRPAGQPEGADKDQAEVEPGERQAAARLDLEPHLREHGRR